MTMRSPAADQDRRRRRVRRLVIIGVLLLVLLATALLWPKPAPGPLSVATTATTQPVGALQGTVLAARSGDHVCYAVSANGTTAVLRFVPGWSADTRLGLRDPSGSVVATPGERITLLGAPGPVGAVPGCSRSGRIWTVTDIRL